MIIPFVVILLLIALGPFILKHFWEKYYHLAALALGSVSIFYYLFILNESQPIIHVAHEYVSFIAMVGSLFVVAGGIHVSVKGEAKPWINCVFLFIGAVIANIIGTTGASMLMIRPWIRMNKYRITGFHIVFFIFIVSNVGGVLTPIGDPPLFLGYLRGVPFWWVIEHCWQAWIIAVFWLIGIFYFLDRRNFKRAPQEVRRFQTHEESWKFTGLHNIIFLVLILCAVFISHPVGLRELIMFAAAIGSYMTTSKTVHSANDFTFVPLKEVAWLFLGIFATMVPALQYIELHSKSLGLNSELQFFWLTGLLSGALDNAPTYLVFLVSAFGLNELNIDNPQHMQAFLSTHSHYLRAISLGAVIFGAMTYIGNGPNFMVKSIAEQAQVETPSFIAYIVKYALPILIPLCFVVSILFFSRWRLF